MGKEDAESPECVSGPFTQGKSDASNGMASHRETQVLRSKASFSMTRQLVSKTDASEIGSISRTKRSKDNGCFSVGSVCALANGRIECATALLTESTAPMSRSGEKSDAVPQLSLTDGRLLASIVALRSVVRGNGLCDQLSCVRTSCRNKTSLTKRAVAKSHARTGAPQRHRSAVQRVQAEAAAKGQGCTLQKPLMGRSLLKRRTAKGLTAILLIVVGQSLAHAEWGFVDSVDDFTDDHIRFAHYSDDDHRIQLSRHDDNSVWMYITRKIGSFEPNTPVEYRVEQGMLRGESMVDYSRMVARLGNAPTYIW